MPALLGPAACAQTRDGLAPVLGDEATTPEKERFARRLHVDLTGLPPAPDWTDAVLRRLDDEGNSAETRASVAAGLIAAPQMAELYVNDVAGEAYSGYSIEAGYDLVCEVVRAMDAACGGCGEPDPCACACPAAAALGAERDALYTIAAGLAAGDGTTTSEMERALVGSAPFLFNGTSPEGIAAQLFEVLLARPPGGDELENARRMTLGSFLPGSPAGLLFHRHGGSHEELIDIVIGSEVYRDAMVSRTFQRYLGRRPTGDELGFFSASLDPARPDMRPLIRAVVSSAEYFQQ